MIALHGISTKEFWNHLVVHKQLCALIWVLGLFSLNLENFSQISLEMNNSFLVMLDLFFQESISLYGNTKSTTQIRRQTEI